MSEANALQVERTGAVLRVTIDRPAKHNPLSRPVLAALRRAFEDTAGDPSLMCAVLSGAGDRYFAAGGDLRDLENVRTPEQAREMASEARAALDAVRNFPVPVVALLNGDAIGGGAELALACDFRVIREGAHIGFIHGRLNISSAWGGGPDLAALVGPARALRMTSRSELVPASLAMAWGLVDASAAQEHLEQTLDEFISPMLRQTPLALRACVEQARAMRRGPGYEERRELEQRNFVDTWVSADHWSAVDRFLSRNGTKS
jgi:enoyl-CoA hydratase